MNDFDTLKRGDEEGEICNRLFEKDSRYGPTSKHCQGIISLHEKGDCSCHINPPCGACTEIREYCPECGWESKHEYRMNEYSIQTKPGQGAWVRWERRPLDPTKIDYHIESHTNSSQKCVGVYPEGTPTEAILERVRGTFGGRFDQLGGGKFVYIAYTD